MKAQPKGNRHVGSSFEKFLVADGILGDADSVAQKRVLAWQISEAMRGRGITKTQMADLMGTSRAAVDRLLDPGNAGVTLATMSRAAAALGARIRIGLEPSGSSKRAGNAGRAGAGRKPGGKV